MRKIYQPRPDLFTIKVWSGENLTLLISCGDDFRVQLTDLDFNNPENPPPMTMLLRKHLSGGKISRITQSGVDRLIKLVVVHKEEKGHYIDKELYVELFGRYSNLILVEDGTVIGVLNENTRRDPPVKIGKNYEVPGSGEKDNPFELSLSRFTNYFQGNRQVWRALLDNIDGIGPTLAKEIPTRAGIQPEAADVTTDKINGLWRATEELVDEMKGSETRPLIYQKKGNPVEFSPVRLQQYAGLNKLDFFSWKNALDYFYKEKILSYSTSSLDEELRETINDELERVDGALQNVEEQLHQAENRERYKEAGDLLLAYASRIEKGQTKVELEDFYSDKETREIELDPSLTPEENAEKYYEKYKKLKRGKEKLEKRRKGLNAEQRFLKRQKEELSVAKSEEEIVAVERELIDKGFIEEETDIEQEDKGGPREYWFKGYKVMVGRNARQNDELVRNSSSHDLWFHVRNYAGAHVVIVTDGRPDRVPGDVTEKAAQLAAYNSKAKNSTKATVSYTQAKYVDKPKGAKPGLVRISNEETVVVNPQEVIS